MATRSDTFEDLKRKRATIKGLSTRFQTFVNDIQYSENLEKSLQLQLNARLANFKALFEKYNEVQFHIESIDDESDHEAERSFFENSYYEYIGKAEELINQQKCTGPQEINVNNRNNNQHHRLRLPKIDLPIFTGQLEQWYPFHDTFNSLIHKNAELDAVEKFHFLKSSVQGDAADVISSFQVSPENYKAAWELLAERYDNKRLIIQTHIKEIFDTTPISKEDGHGLRLIIDKVMKHLRALEALKRPTDKWDDLLVHLIATKIDALTNKEWESSLDRMTLPTFKGMIDFLTRKCHTLELLTRNTYQPIQQMKNATFQTSKPSAQFQDSCVICHKPHKIFTCDKFLKEDVDQRIRLVQSKNLCTNCLRASNHQAIDCKSGACKKCNRKHNTLLHKTSQDRPTSAHLTQEVNAVPLSNTHTCSAKQHAAQVLLSTAIVNVLDKDNQRVKCRALLDSGSQSNFVTSEFALRIGIKLQPIKSLVTGISQAPMNIRHQTVMSVQSCHNSFKTNLQCLLINDITGHLPSVTFEKKQVVIPNNIKLADPDFNVSAKIDLLIGADTFWNLLCVGQVRTCKQQPVFKKTRLGWIISGNLKFLSPTSNSWQNHCLHTSLVDVDNKLEKFCQLEEVPQTKASNFSEEELACENHSAKTYMRKQDGRFCVKLPMKSSAASHFEGSKQLAMQRFYSLERKFIKNPDYARQYKDFIDEYRNLGHMNLISQPEVAYSTLPYYMPHHAVLKEDSLTTKLRVVFDASAKTGNGPSLNETLRLGPTLQEDIFSIISRFRTHRYVLMADIEKMYRQISVDESQRHLQRILWRDNEQDIIQTYELATVTYGTAAAPYLATRCLQQLGKDYEVTHPNASKIILRDFYVDDLLTRAEVQRKEVTLERRNAMTTLVSKKEEPFELFDKYSSITKLVRVTAYCIRFYKNIRAIKSALPENRGTLAVAELNTATDKLIKIAQRTSFPTELDDLKKHSCVNKRSRILSLHPFIDDIGIIRVGGRLHNAKITSDQKHPIVLPQNHKLTKLIISDEHIRNCHSGAQSTLSAVRQRYWPISGRNLVRQIINKCIICFRTKPIPVEQLMGSLPEHRVQEARPFTNCGVDFFGPLYLRDGRRGSKSKKAYGSIFVCFATKAVHIELVSDLSTAAFLAALKRFMARRGMISHIYSDNGTNFVGANKELKDLYEFVCKESHHAEINLELSKQKIEWHFIPASSPHFGGLWEAAVKAAKSHLRKVVGNIALTFEEMTTFLAQIESILNSRPITPMSTDPNDLSFLTPGHFLIGAPLTANVEPSLLHLPVNRLSKWQHLEQMRQHFWKRWKREYFNQLQQRVKWRSNSNVNSLQVGDLVIVKEDNIPPLFWMMGRIEAIHSGSDGITRAATVKTRKGSLRRATTKLCPLPST